MKHKPFSANQFTATKWASTEDKAKWANHFVRFAESDFKETLFYKDFYTQLSNMFHHIAEFNRQGFYSVWFSTDQNKIRFLKRCLESASYGDPSYTWSDVESVIRQWVFNRSDLVNFYMLRASKAIETEERAELARLQAKYK